MIWFSKPTKKIKEETQKKEKIVRVKELLYEFDLLYLWDYGLVDKENVKIEFD